MMRWWRWSLPRLLGGVGVESIDEFKSMNECKSMALR